jgi:hypothetical protein
MRYRRPCGYIATRSRLKLRRRGFRASRIHKEALVHLKNVSICFTFLPTKCLKLRWRVPGPLSQEAFTQGLLGFIQFVHIKLTRQTTTTHGNIPSIFIFNEGRLQTGLSNTLFVPTSGGHSSKYHYQLGPEEPATE